MSIQNTLPGFETPDVPEQTEDSDELDEEGGRFVYCSECGRVVEYISWEWTAYRTSICGQCYAKHYGTGTAEEQEP
jgi:hypothetical protein